MAPGVLPNPVVEPPESKVRWIFGIAVEARVEGFVLIGKGLGCQVRQPFGDAGRLASIASGIVGILTDMAGPVEGDEPAPVGPHEVGG